MSLAYSDSIQQLYDYIDKSFKSGNITILKHHYEKLKMNESDKKTALDQAFREFLLKNIIGDKSRIEEFLALSIESCRQDLVTPAVPVILLSDLFDVINLEDCESLFTFVENNVDIWKEDWFFGACKNNLLRMCNDLLRRLSRSQNTVFCGRILLFLAKFFPFSERSGLNIVSEFNLENLTEFDSDVNGSGDALIEAGNAQIKIDYNLYCKFWALQDFFRNPNQCYNKDQWKVFANDCNAVLSAFSSFKLEEHRTSIDQKNLQIDAMDIDELNQDSQYFFAKFLTNPKLLSLQLSDSNFRRSVLVQCLILFQYLRSTVKFKAESFNLTSNQLDYIKETDTQIYKLLDETPPNGHHFSKTVKHMLNREELWNNWKNEGCKEFKRPIEDEHDETLKPPNKKRSLGIAVSESRKQNNFYLGNIELTRLWNLCPDNLQACRGADRNFLPSIESYLESPKDKIDPSYEWRALRLLARQSPHFFTLIQTPNKVSEYLEGVRKKIVESKIKIKHEVVAIKQETDVAQEKDDGLVDVQDEAELLKTEQLTPEDKNTYKVAMPTQEQIAELAVIIGGSWKKLGSKLGYGNDELKYFADSNETVPEQGRALLRIWFENDEDASLENLGYIMEGLDMITAADWVKKLIEPADNMEDISE